MAAEVTTAELEFMYYKQGTAGSFRTGLYDLYFKADFINQSKLESLWPDLSVVRRYANEPGYWEDLQARFNSHKK
jgi:hypothetical protein